MAAPTASKVINDLCAHWPLIIVKFSSKQVVKMPNTTRKQSWIYQCHCHSS